MGRVDYIPRAYCSLNRQHRCCQFDSQDQILIRLQFQTLNRVAIHLSHYSLLYYLFWLIKYNFRCQINRPDKVRIIRSCFVQNEHTIHQCLNFVNWVLQTNWENNIPFSKLVFWNYHGFRILNSIDTVSVNEYQVIKENVFDSFIHLFI